MYKWILFVFFLCCCCHGGLSSNRHLPPPPPPPPPMQQGNQNSSQNKGDTDKSNNPPPPPPQQQQHNNNMNPTHQQQRPPPPPQQQQRLVPPPQQRHLPPPQQQQQRYQHIPRPQKQQASSFERPRQPLPPPQQQHHHHHQQQYARPPYQNQNHYRPQQQQQLQPYYPPRQPVQKKSVPFWKRMADTLEDKLSKVDETIAATTQRAIRAVKPPSPSQGRVPPSSNSPPFNQHRPSQPSAPNTRSFENHLNNLLSSSYPIQSNDDDIDSDYDEETDQDELIEDVNPFRGIMPTPGGHSPQSTTTTTTEQTTTTTTTTTSNHQHQTRNEYDEDERWSRDVATHTRTAPIQNNNIHNRSRNVLRPWIEELQQGKGYAQSCTKGRLAGFMDALPILFLLLVVTKSNDWWLEFFAISILSHYTRQLLLLKQKPQTKSTSIQDLFISCFSSKIQNYQELYQKYTQQLIQSCRKHFFTLFLLITATLQFLPTNYGMIQSNIAVPTNLDSVKDYFQNSFSTQLQNLIPSVINTYKQNQNFILQTPTFVLTISSWIVIFINTIILPSSPSLKRPTSQITSKQNDNNRLMLQAIGTSSATRLSILTEPGQPIIHRQLAKHIHQQQQSQVQNSKKPKKNIMTYIQQSLLFTPVLLFLILKGMQYTQQDGNELNVSSILSNLQSLENWYDFNLGEIFNTWWKELQREGNDWKSLGIWSYILHKTFRVLQQSCPSKPLVQKDQLTQLLQQLISIANWQPPSQQQQSLSQIHVHDLWAAHSAKRAWATKGVTMNCKSGEVILILGNGKTRLLSAITETILKPPQMTQSTILVRGNVQYQGNVHLSLQDVTTNAQLANLYSGSTIQQILQTSPNSMDAIEKAMKLTNFDEIVLSDVTSTQTKLQSIVTTQEQDLANNNNDSSSTVVLSPSEWSCVFLTKVLAQAYSSNTLKSSVLLLDQIMIPENYEGRFIQKLQQSGAATILTSNRWTLGRFANRIIVLKDGAVVESGTHLELLSQPNSQYAQQWKQITSM